MSEFESHRPEESWEWEDVRLNTLEFAPGPLIEELAEHHIDTVGALLGATRGLSMALTVSDPNQEAADTFIAKLIDTLPAELVERYRAAQPDIPPPGILPGPDPLGGERQ